ncbi:phosphoethanolamine transferase [Sulfurimonas sp.]|jgi:glucan phosphoethanolaminetransferase (alkaline phosphatase superfamily)|uniref:phosphoethanolamine transferase n=1 Tax=Sulfurimonas sp. TaxID=2022749 RepID=UPI0025E66F8D|nr:phosphoethanolamine transferase [Sulfurimonas sp.]
MINNFLIKIKNNFIIASSTSLFLLIAEQLFRLSNPLLVFNLDSHKVIVQFAISFTLLLLVSKKAIQGLFTFILIFMFMQFLHFNYYGTWIFPLEYLLLFTKFTETLDTFSTVLEITVIPILIMLPTSLIVFFLLKKLNNQRVTLKYLSFVMILFLLFIPLRVYVKKESKKGARPNIEVSAIVNGVETMGYFLGRIAPQKLFGTGNLSKNIVKTPTIIEKTPDINIVVIMGESLTHSKMSLFGEQDITTPNLDKLSTDKNFFKQIAFTSGIVTDVALPSFFNILYEPDSTEQIISTNTCLFKMAKDNGFETYFYSSQSQIGLAYIKSYLCLNAVDNYMDGTDDTHELKKNALDEVLVDRLENVNFKKSNFIVLHQIGSHSPYELRYPKEFAKFKSNKDDKYDRNSYKNSILYTDYIITKIIKTLENKTKKPTYVFFTSDHGEGIETHRGHGNLKLASNYEVPYFVYTLNVNNRFKKEVNSKYTSHYKISKQVATTLGYDISNMKHDENKYVVCGKDLCGVAGYLELYVDKDEIVKKRIK